jgi:methionine synthase II (cobalamin-independent)
MISRTITIEELVQAVPEAVTYLMRNGIKCLACGEPIWGTLESAAKEKGFGEEEIARFERELSAILQQREE